MDDDNKSLEESQAGSDEEQIDATLQITEQLLVILGEAWARIDLLESQVKILKMGHPGIDLDAAKDDVSSGHGVVIIDDSVIMQKRLCSSIEPLGFKVIGTAEDGPQGAKLVGRLKPKLVILDPLMQDMDGLACLKTIRQKDSEVKIILCTGKLTTALGRDYMQYGISAIMAKPLQLDRFVSAVRKCMTLDSDGKSPDPK